MQVWFLIIQGVKKEARKKIKKAKIIVRPKVIWIWRPIGKKRTLANLLDDQNIGFNSMGPTNHAREGNLHVFGILFYIISVLKCSRLPGISFILN